MKVVQVCGFEALPPDLAVQLAAETARERWDAELDHVDVTIAVTGRRLGCRGPRTRSPAGPSRAWPRRSAATTPACSRPGRADLRPANGRRGPRPQPDRAAPAPRCDGAAIAPMSPAAYINPAVIHRTAAVTAAERGVALQPFRYREGIAIGGSPATLPFRLCAAAMLAGTQAGVRAAANARPQVREKVAGGLRKVLPSSGFGPAGDRLEQWRWRLVAEARTAGGNELTSPSKPRAIPAI